VAREGSAITIPLMTQFAMPVTERMTGQMRGCQHLPSSFGMMSMRSD
jgi:hypothetical protein